MTYFSTVDNFRRWLNRAQTALVSKNKVRKDLWSDFCEIIVFELPDSPCIPVSKSNFTSISTFLQTEGRGDSLKDDSVLNWVTTLHDLRQLLNEEIRYIAATRVQSPISTINNENKYVQPTNSRSRPVVNVATGIIPEPNVSISPTASQAETENLPSLVDTTNTSTT